MNNAKKDHFNNGVEEAVDSIASGSANIR